MISKESTVGFLLAMLWHSSDIAITPSVQVRTEGEHTLVEKP